MKIGIGRSESEPGRLFY